MTAAAVPGRLRKLLFRLATLAVGLTLGLGIAEIAVRVAGLGTATLSRGRLHAYDPDAGWTCTPNLDARYVQPDSFDVRITTNEQGLRDGPLEFEKPPGLRRVVVLGDSFMWGYGVEDDETLASVLQELLVEVETVNLGANGYSTVQEAVRLEQEGLRYQPDVVVLAFTWNDVSSNPDDKKGGRPYAVLSTDGALTILNRPVRRPWKSSWVQWLRHHSRLYIFIEYCGEVLKSRAATRRRLEERDAARESAPALVPGRRDGDDITVLDVFGPPSASGEEGWKLLESVIRKIRDDARQAGARLILLNNTSREEVFPEILRHLARVTADQAEEFGLDPDRPGAMLQGIADRLGIAFVDPTPRFRAHPDHESLYLRNNGHWSAAGQRLVAETLSPAVRRILGE